jgi:chromosome segregation ATPase
MATTIETDLKEILGEFKQEFTKINQRLDRMETDLTTIKVDVATVKTTVNSLENRMDKLDNRLDKIETEQKTLIKDIADLKGAKSLIIPIIVAVTTSLITLLIRAIPNP